MRLAAFQEILQGLGVGVALFFDNDSNVAYFSGVAVERGCLAIPAEGGSVLFVPGFEAERLAKGAVVDVAKVDSDLLGTVQKRFPAKSIGINPAKLVYARAQELEKRASLVNVEEACRKLRMVKTREEIRRITRACAITDALFEGLCAEFSAFETEADVAGFLGLRMAQLGVEPSFPIIVATGENAAVPHHVPTKAKLSGFTVIDFGVKYQNYCSDMTRTVFAGNPSKAQRRAYENLRKVQEECVKKVKPGMSFEDVDAFAKKKVGRSMIHRVGHSLGVDVHDVQVRPMMLQPGNVVTIEPGTYHNGKFGIRIEDDVLVTKGGGEALTRSSKELVAFRRKL